MQNVEIINLPYQQSAEDLFASIRHLPDAIWLDAGRPAYSSSQFDIITASPSVVLETRGKETQIITTQSTTISSENPFDLCEQLFLSLKKTGLHYDDYPFIGGLAGYFGYDLGQPMRDQPPKLDSLPDMRIGHYQWALVLDHFSKKSWLFFNADCLSSLRKEVIKCINNKSQDICKKEKNIYRNFISTTKKDCYMSAIAKVKNYILAGDCYQVNYAQHFSAEFKADNWELYKELRRSLPAPYSCYYQLGDSKQAILSFSPERFIKLDGNKVETKPIKGTIRRGVTEKDDILQITKLINSKKDKAENLMIVDLLRNDLGKSCIPGSIQTPRLFEIESFENVHHLVSTITGLIRKNETPISLLRRCFPGGSITGAPKKRAMEIIDELESCKRSVYCGSIGYISITGKMDTSIAIRTLISDGERLHCWGGGGIVADSNAADEYQEIFDKISLLIKSNTIQETNNRP